MKLVVVESPTKARKLSQYLGKEYKIEASVGHVRDLPKSQLGIDLKNDFQPTYQVDPEKNHVVNKLKELASQAEAVYLATDPDREGEAIAWHIHYLLTHDETTSSSKAKQNKATEINQHLPFWRSTFHEITKTAVQAAIDHPGKISLPLVDAQQARRVVDRLVGYQVSPVLWKKVRRGLSAGRVQSVALRLIVEREREIEAFKAEEYWEVDVALNPASATAHPERVFVEGKVPEALAEKILVSRVVEVAGSAFATELKKYAPSSQEQVDPLLTFLPTAHYQIKNVETKTRERQSLAPFTTSTLQQAAANRLGYTSKQTMSLAQKLYEEGLITYHRTDSVSLSEQATTMAREYIADRFGAAYVPAQPRRFANKSKNAQEAHEAIRVTDVRLTPESALAGAPKLTETHQKLYDLIWRRFLASQMAAAQSDATTVTILATASQPVAGAPVTQATLRTSGSVMKFAGWTTLFPNSEDTILPPVQSGEELSYLDQTAAQKFTQPPARYNDASLVKELEKRGIGRPSTYASIISVIVDRSYVERKERRFIPTAIGRTVADFLIQHFPTFMEYDFTAEMEENLDSVARGEKNWTKVVGTFYTPLAETIAKVTDTADRMQIPMEKTGESCPTCGATEGGEVVIRSGKYGKFKSCSRYPDCNYTDRIIEKVPDVLCPLCQEGEVIIKSSRWGKSFFGCSRYPQCDWASWLRPKPGDKISIEVWQQLQAERAAKKAAKLEKQAGAAPAAPVKKKPTRSKKKPSSRSKK